MSLNRTKNLLMAGLLVCLAGVITPATAQDAPPPADGAFQIGDTLAAGDGATSDGFQEISWDDLIPPDWLPEDLFAGLFDDANMDALDDYDPRAVEIMEKIREMWDSAPVVDRFDGRRIRIPGFVVPLESDGQNIHEFLLVPYFGACIHVPPPPANQLIHVMPDSEIPAAWNMVPVWVSGVLTVARFNSELGSAGYQMRGIRVEEYKE
ncbi:DUF3299 domain-containing protein [Rhodocyclaceae bacterium SMB388]